MTASISKGKFSKYAYYHCNGARCKGRFRADVLNICYEEALKKIKLRPQVFELFSLILEDENIFSRRREYVDSRKKILGAVTKQQYHISKVRRFFLDEKIDFDDFSKLKKEHNEVMSQLTQQLNSINQKLTDCNNNNNLWPDTHFNVFRSYKEQDVKGKRDIVSLCMPGSINTITTSLDFLKIDEVISLIAEYHN